jgi:hypothetical protein
MHAYLKIGDTSLTIQPVLGSVGDDRHQIVVSDAWNAGHAETVAGVVKDTISQSVVVERERDAIAVLVAFLEIEEPGEAFTKLFPLHGP